MKPSHGFTRILYGFFPKTLTAREIFFNHVNVNKDTLVRDFICFFHQRFTALDVSLIQPIWLDFSLEQGHGRHRISTSPGERVESLFFECFDSRDLSSQKHKVTKIVLSVRIFSYTNPLRIASQLRY